MALQHLRSSTADKRPTPGAMSDGQLAMNTNLVSPGLFLKDSNGDLVKVGPVHVGTTAPNATPGAGGQAGNSKGEQWLDTSSSRYVFKIWDGTAWRTEDGEFVNTSGDTMTGALGIIAGTAAAPGVFFSGDLNTGIYSPGADQLAISTSGTQRILFDAAGNITLSADADNTGVSSAINFNVDGLEACDINNAGYLRFNKTNFSGGGVCTQELDSVLNLGGGSNTLNNGLNLSLSGPDRVSDVGYQMRWNTNLLYRWEKTSDFHIWYTGTSNERMRLDSSGRLGLGTSSPGSALEINAAAATSPFIAKINTSEVARIDSSGRLLVGTPSSLGTFSKGLEVANNIAISAFVNNAFGFELAFNKSRGESSGTIVQNEDQIGSISWRADDGVDTETIAARISCEIDGTPGANDMPGRLKFSVTADGASSPTERMRIVNDGRTDVFATAETLRVRTTATTAAAAITIRMQAAATTLGTGGTTEFQVTSNGNVANTNNAYGAISDIKLKENIVDASSQWDDLKALQVRNYNFKEGQTHTQIGLIAQEVELVSPGLVSESPDRDAEGNDLGTVTKSVNYSVLYMKAVKALQEAMERIETLEAKVAALEAQ